MIVVSDTSPITNLAAIKQFALLQKLYGSVYIAEGVWVELNAKGQTWPGSEEVRGSPWIKRKEVKNKTAVATLREDLDQGESETIALAIEQKADLILMDETEGRHKAKRLGLNVAGVIGILLEAKSKSHIPQIRYCLDKLRQEAGFYLTQIYHQR